MYKKAPRISVNKWRNSARKARMNRLTGVIGRLSAVSAEFAVDDHPAWSYRKVIDAEIRELKALKRELEIS